MAAYMMDQGGHVLRARMAWAARTTLLALVLAACGDGPTKPGDGPTKPEDVTFAASLGVDLTQMTQLPSGVYIQILTPGVDAEVTGSDGITADYKLWIPDGTLIQSDRLNNYPVTDFVPGFTDGVIGMRRTEVRKIVIPSRLGYSSEARPGLPEHSVLIFEVTLLQIN